MTSSRAAIIASMLLLWTITFGLFLTDAGVSSPLRHLYFLPVLWGAGWFGRRGGTLTGLCAVFLYAPILIPAVERQGPSLEVAEGLVTMILLLSVGLLTGRFVDQAQIEAGRYRTLSEIQRALSGEGELSRLLERAATFLLQSHTADRVSLLLVLPEGERLLLVVGADDSPQWLREGMLNPNERSAVAWVMRHRQLLYVPDLVTDHRFDREPGWTLFPRRVVLIPLLLADESLGVLTIERLEEFGPAERDSIKAMGLEIALGIEHARLTLRQRRFAEDLETKVTEATRHLLELDQAKSDFVSMASHELRTPLTSIQGFTELLLTRESSPARARQFLEYIHREALRLGHIVSDLLDLSRIELGRTIELRRGPVGVAPILERQVTLFQNDAPRHRIVWESEDGLPEIDADQEKVDQIVQNLLSNAIKYSPAGGTITLVGRRSARPGWVELSVSDEGVGIPPDALPMIFEKYYRVPDPALVQIRGFGLGLSLVKTLVEAHGGEIHVSSQPGAGTCFLLRFPAYPSTISPAPAAAPEAHPR